jgi:hypothetical protein
LDIILLNQGTTNQEKVCLHTKSTERRTEFPHQFRKKRDSSLPFPTYGHIIISMDFGAIISAVTDCPTERFSLPFPRRQNRACLIGSDVFDGTIMCEELHTSAAAILPHFFYDSHSRT